MAGGTLTLALLVRFELINALKIFTALIRFLVVHEFEISTFTLNKSGLLDASALCQPFPFSKAFSVFYIL